MKFWNIVVLFLFVSVISSCGDDDPSCTDGEQNQFELGIDCCGPCDPCYELPTCDPINGPIISCSDGVQNGDETGIDCGGTTCEPCSSANCFDGIQNGEETGIDCGGPDCPACAQATCIDGVQNGDEIGIDCGGATCPPCDQVTCSDGVQNGDEEGVDCGGATCPPCDQVTCSDGVQNGDEEGVDCGGATCPPCSPEPSSIMTAMIDGSGWSSSQAYSATFNQSLEFLILNGTESNGSQITMTLYLVEGTTGDIAITDPNFIAYIIGIDSCGTLDSSTGTLNLSEFNTTDHLISGTFSFNCSLGNGGYEITEGVITNLPYFIQ